MRVRNKTVLDLRRKSERKKRNDGKIAERFVLTQEMANPSCIGKKAFISASGNYVLSGRHS